MIQKQRLFRSKLFKANRCNVYDRWLYGENHEQKINIIYDAIVWVGRCKCRTRVAPYIRKWPDPVPVIPVTGLSDPLEKYGSGAFQKSGSGFKLQKFDIYNA